ncbi:MAG: hypothetical protein ACYCZY_08100 [Lacisediminihabitans sp.]
MKHLDDFSYELVATFAYTEATMTELPDEVVADAELTSNPDGDSRRK